MPLLTPFVALLALQYDWQNYTLGPGFRVDLPFSPEEMVKAGVKPDPRSGVWVSRFQRDSMVVIGCSPYRTDDPNTSPDKILRNSVFAAVGTARGKILSQKDILLDGWPGTEYRISNAQGFYGIGRTYVANTGVISLYVTSHETKELEGPAKKVFSSLRFPRTAGKGPLTVAGPEFKPFTVGKTGVTVNLPGTPVEERFDMPGPHKRSLFRYMSKYVTRTYAVGYMDLDEDEVDAVEPADIDEVLASMHLDLARGIDKDLKGVNPVRAKLAGRDSFRTKFPVDGGVAQARIETVMIGTRVFLFLTVVTTPFAKSAEVEKFFTSIKVE